MHYPTTPENTLKSLRLTEKIITKLSDYRKRMIFDPPASGLSDDLVYAEKAFNELKDLLSK